MTTSLKSHPFGVVALASPSSGNGLLRMRPTRILITLTDVANGLSYVLPAWLRYEKEWKCQISNISVEVLLIYGHCILSMWCQSGTEGHLFITTETIHTRIQTYPDLKKHRKGSENYYPAPLHFHDKSEIDIPPQCNCRPEYDPLVNRH